MTPPPVDELSGKEIKRVQVYSNIVFFELGDGKTIADVRLVDGKLRLHVTKKLSVESAPPAVSVYPGEFPRDLP